MDSFGKPLGLFCYFNLLIVKIDFFCLNILVCGFLWLSVAHQTDKPNSVPTGAFTKKEDIEIYFAAKRKQHLDAVQTLMTLKRYEQKHEMIRRIFEKIFDVVIESRAKVENSDYILGDALPQSAIVEDILQILDNCAFFGNLVLKFPDITKRLLKDNNQWVEMYKWGFTFSISSNLLDQISLKMFNLTAQQLELIPKSEDFVNPYEESHQKKLRKSFTKPMNNNNKTRKKKIERGPRLSKSEL